MGIFGKMRQRKTAEGGFANKNNEAADWSKLSEQAAEHSRASWDDLNKEPDFYARQNQDNLKQREESSSSRENNGSNAKVEIGEFVDPYEPEPGREGFDFARRQRQIIAAFESDMGAGAMVRGDVKENPYWRGQFLDQIAEGVISDASEKNFLEAIPSDMNKRPKAETLSMIGGDAEVQRAFWALTGGHMDEEGLLRLNSPEPGKKDYRTPLDFAEFKTQYLQGFKNDRQGYAKAADSLNTLSNILYGKDQIKYYEAFESLKQRAFYNKYKEDLENGVAVSSDSGSSNRAESSRTRTASATERVRSTADGERTESDEDVLRILSKQESERLMAGAVIDGDPWKQGGMEYSLTKESLEQLDLGPKFEVEMNGVHIGLSEIYRVSNKYKAALGYVSTEQGVKVRSYYLDDKDGAWKYLPDYCAEDIDSGGYARTLELGKGYDESSVVLPAKLQKGLYDIYNVEPKTIDDKANSWFVFAGTAKRYNSQFEYSNAFFSGQMRGDYYREVNNKPSFFDLDKEQNQKPDDIAVEKEYMPNFTQEVSKYEGWGKVLGKFEAESFRSQNDELTWTFYNKDNKVCVGHVDVGNTTTSTGLNQDWASLGNLGKQIYEEYHPGLIDDYGDFRSNVDYNDQVKLADGQYVGMWNNYLRKIPLIREYVYRKMKREMDREKRR